MLLLFVFNSRIDIKIVDVDWDTYTFVVFIVISFIKVFLFARTVFKLKTYMIIIISTFSQQDAYQVEINVFAIAIIDSG